MPAAPCWTTSRLPLALTQSTPCLYPLYPLALLFSALFLASLSTPFLHPPFLSQPFFNFFTPPHSLPFFILTYVAFIAFCSWLTFSSSGHHAPGSGIRCYITSDRNIGPRNFAWATAHTAVSDILLNDELSPSDAVDLIDDVCRTARLAGVDVRELLSRTVFKGYSDTGNTPLCLEASRAELEKDGGLELVRWLMLHMRPYLAWTELRKRCLMRKEGDAAWNMLRECMPDAGPDGNAPPVYGW